MTLQLSLDVDESSPLYAQVYRQIRDAILAGVLPAGSRLPATRQLAQEHKIARITVTQAYDQLFAEGFVSRRRGAGTYVTDQLPRLGRTKQAAGRLNKPVAPYAEWGQRITANRGIRTDAAHRANIIYDFGFGRPFRQIFPYDTWRRLLARYLSSDDMILSRYESAAGFMPLRRAVADYLVRMRGVRCDASQVVMVSGSQQALDILSRLLINPGDEIYVESPGYIDAYELFRVHGAQLTPFAVDASGFPTARLDDSSNVQLAFITPSNQFPNGGALPLERRLKLLEWASHANAYVIEDDYDGELRYRGRPIASLQGLDDANRVIYLGSFSKVLFPALRLGYVVLPPALVAPFKQTKTLIDSGAPTLTQAAVTDFIVEGHYERHLRRLRKAYAERRATLLKALKTHLPADFGTFVDEPAGFHILYKFKQPLDEEKLVKLAAAAGIAIYPGAPYHLLRPQNASILLGFSGLNVEDIDPGIKKLASILLTRS